MSDAAAPAAPPAAADPNVLQDDLTLLSWPEEPGPILAKQVGTSSYYTVAIVTVVVLVLAWIALRVRRYLKNRPEYREPADAVALRELAQWQQLSDAGRYREAIVEVSATIRRYVEARFGLRAPLLTTEEFWIEQRKSAQIPDTYNPFWESFLDATDWIKYAGATPLSDQFNHLVTSAVDFVTAARDGAPVKVGSRS
jgi:hypothetical protein